MLYDTQFAYICSGKHVIESWITITLHVESTFTFVALICFTRMESFIHIRKLFHFVLGPKRKLFYPYLLESYHGIIWTASWPSSISLSNSTKNMDKMLPNITKSSYHKKSQFYLIYIINKRPQTKVMHNTRSESIWFATRRKSSKKKAIFVTWIILLPATIAFYFTLYCMRKNSRNKMCEMWMHC